MNNDIKYSLNKVLLDNFSHRLTSRRNLEIYKSNFQDWDFLVTSIFEQINVYLKERLFSKTLIYELSVAKHAGILEGATPEDRFNSFIDYTNDEEWTSYFAEKYPSLLAMAKTVMDGLVDFLFKVIEDFMEDRTALEKIFDFVKNKRITSIELINSDLHNHTSVCILGFGNSRIFYKPKSLELESWFENFVKTIDAKFAIGIKSKFPLMVVAKDHGWSEAINHTLSPDEPSIGEYYFTLGFYTAIFAVLGSYDLINDNIICHDGCPVFIDLETLVFKQRADHYNSYAQNSLEKHLGRILGLGILPNANSVSLHGTQDFDGALVPRPTNLTLPIWLDKGKDTMRQAIEGVTIEDNDQRHLPYDPSKLPFKQEFADRFSEGFRICYEKVLMENREFFNVELFRGLHGVRLRVLVRHTVDYSKIMDEMIHPIHMNTEEKLNSFLDNIIQISDRKHLTRKILESEIRQLKKLDVPYFHSFINDTDLYDANGAVMPLYFLGNDIPTIIDGIQTLDEKDLSDKLWVIKTKLDFFLKDKLVKTVRSVQKLIDYEPIRNGDKASILELAKKIGDELLAISIERDESVGFFATDYGGLESVRNVGLLKPDLYSGKLGIALFMAYLYRYTDSEKYLSIAKKIAIETLNLYGERIKAHDFAKDRDLPFSPYFFPIDILYVCYHLKNITGQPDLFDRSIELVQPILHHAVDMNVDDFLTGRAGLLTHLVDLAIDHPLLRPFCDQLVDKIIETKALIDNGYAWESVNLKTVFSENKVYLGGFSHGVSGIALGLAKYYKIFGNREGLIDTIKGALNYERKLFSIEENRWIDMRFDGPTELNLFWCHGSAGIILAEMLILDIEDLAVEILPITHYKSTMKIWEDIFQNGLFHNYGVCHGDMSNLEILYGWAKKVQDEDLQLKVRNVLFGYHKKIVVENFKFPSYESVSLFEGITGIGFTALRFYDWENMPSILSLE